MIPTFVIPDLPPPIVRTEGIPDDVVDRFMAEQFCAKLSEVTGADLVDVRTLCAHMSGNLKPLLHSSQGWSTLAVLMADADKATILAAPLVSTH